MLNYKILPKTKYREKTAYEKKNVQIDVCCHSQIKWYWGINQDKLKRERSIFLQSGGNLFKINNIKNEKFSIKSKEKSRYNPIFGNSRSK